MTQTQRMVGEEKDSEQQRRKRMRALSDLTIEAGLSDAGLPASRFAYRLGRTLPSDGLIGARFEARRRQSIGIAQRVEVRLLAGELCQHHRARELVLEDLLVALSLSHAAVPPILDIVELSEGALGVVTPAIDGPSIAELLHASHTLPTDVAVAIAYQVLSALEHAHQLCDEAGRLLAPRHHYINPYAVHVDGAGSVHVTGFGLHRLCSRHRDDSEHALDPRVLSFAAPEVRQGSETERRSDVYSVGALLYAMTVGMVPQEPLRPPTVANHGFSAQLELVLLSALESVAGDRPQSAATMMLALEDVIDGEALWLTTRALGRHVRRLTSR